MSENFTVILDAGHGGSAATGGSTPNNAVGANGLLEKDLTLNLAGIAAAKLHSKGFRVLLTRAGDENPALTERAGKSKEIGADAFVSIHFNASKDQKIDGTEVFVSHASDEKDFALANELLTNTAHAAEIAPRGIRQTNFTVLKGAFHVPKTAACLIEIAYLTNPRQAQKLLSPVYIERLAEAVAQSISNYSTRFSYTKQDHELAFNLTKPEKSPALGFSYGLEDELSPAHFLPLDYFQTRAFDATCAGNSAGIKRGESFVENAAMPVESDRLNKKENVFLRWCDIPKEKCEIDIVVHFHGWNVTNEQKFFDYAVKYSGLDLLKPDGTLTRPRPTLCILPLGKASAKLADGRIPYKFSFFTKEEALRNLINNSLKTLASIHKQPGTAFQPARLILTAHSGGGEAVSAILGLNSYETGKVRLKYVVNEVHLFDSTYGGQNNIIEWAKFKIQEDSRLSAAELSGKHGALRVIYTPFLRNCAVHGTSGGSRDIEAGIKKILDTNSHLKPWYRVQQTRIEHNRVPKTFGFQLLADASSKLDDTFATADFAACYLKKPAEYSVKEPFKQQSFEYEDPNYYAESEADFMNYSD